jgi:sec-independent protein translocase protein TatA
MLAFFSLGWPEIILAGTVAVLLFGKRLPEVGRSLGRGIIELKKGLRGIADDVETTGQEKSGSPESKKTPGLSRNKFGNQAQQP